MSEAPARGPASTLDEREIQLDEPVVSERPPKEDRDRTTRSPGEEIQGSTVRHHLIRPRTLVSFALALAILAAFALRADLNLSEIWQNIQGANLMLLTGAVTVYYFTLLLRAYRWRWMLSIGGIGQESGTKLPPVSYLTGIVVISWLVNCVVPAKLGDAYRAYRVRRDDGVRYSIGFGTIFSERIVDLLILMVMLSASALLSFKGSLPGQTGTAMILGGMMVAGVLLGLFVMLLFRERILALLPNRWRSHYTKFQETLFLVLRSPLFPVTIAGLIWLAEGLRVFLVSEALGAELSFELAVFVALMSALLTTLPVTPAGLGVVEVAIVSALTFVDVPSSMAGSVAVLDRLITYWGIIVIGSVVALIMTRSRELERDAGVSKGQVRSIS